ncbi:hypothetical protein ACFLYC_00525 [Chloroflexota bacterium]
MFIIKHKPLTIIVTIDGNIDHRKNTYALASEVIVLIALTFSSISSEDKPITFVFFVSIIINPHNPIKAVEHTNATLTNSTQWTMPVKKSRTVKTISKANEAATITTMIAKRFAELVIGSMYSRISFVVLLVFMTAIIPLIPLLIQQPKIIPGVP